MEGLTEEVILGFGSHFSTRTAISRALGEVNQLLFPLPSDTSDAAARYRRLGAYRAQWLQRATVEAHRYLVPDPARPLKHAETFVDVPCRGVDHALRVCVERARAAGLEMLYHDLTRPEVGMPVAKVIVPGLLHFWRRFGHERLYKIPVQEGWLTRPYAEHELNSESIAY